MPASMAEDILSSSVLVHNHSLFLDDYRISILMEHEDGCVRRADRSLLSCIILFLENAHSTTGVSNPDSR